MASWTQKKGLNCYIGHGATQIDDDSLHSMTISACQKKCDDRPDCTGITVQNSDSECFRRKDIVVANCSTEFGTDYDTWVKQGNVTEYDTQFWRKPAPERLGKVVHPEPPLPDDWKRHDSSNSLSTVAFRVSLKQPGMEKVRQIAKRVSDPSDSMYGKYLTQNQLDELMVPPKQALDTVARWATKGSCSASVLREVVSISCDSAAAEALLETECHMLQNHVTKQQAVRCSDYSLPKDVHELTQAVYGLHGLPMPPQKSERGRRLQFPPGQQPAKVTPAVIASTYKVSGVNASGSEKNRQAVAEFQGQTMSSDDLDTFFKTYLPHVKNESTKVHKYVGDPGAGYSETEADLDIQYIMGVAPGVLTEFWYFRPSDFCGDLKNWTQTILATEDPPLVHSVSYGWQGNLTTLMGCKMDNVNDVDADFAKLAARGITIVFASGDSGSGYMRQQPQCRPPPSVEKGMELTGTLHTSESASSEQDCCYLSSNAGALGWTYEAPKQETCSEQLVVKGVSWDGSGEAKSGVNSSEACCSLAQSESQSAWSYDKQHQQCIIFTSVLGRVSDPGSISGMGEPATRGKCNTYSKITGKQPNSRASSAVLAGAGATLFPSWPASSPWVTSVGATRFVDQKVGQPEMATDQFGSGGGFSQMFDAFDDQKGDIAHYYKVAPQLPPHGTFPRSGRATPDVAALGEGYQVVIHGQPESVDGTSASAPMFAGLVSLLNEARLAKKMPPMGFLNPWLYKHADAFTDITRGDNLRGRGPFVEPYGFNCTAGWDPVTGLGTPLFDKMLSAATSSSSAGASVDIVV